MLVWGRTLQGVHSKRWQWWGFVHLAESPTTGGGGHWQLVSLLLLTSPNQLLLLTLDEWISHCISHQGFWKQKFSFSWVRIRLSCHGWWRPTPPCQPPPPFNSSSLFLSNLPLILPAGQMAKWLKTASSSLVPTLKIEEASYERAAISFPTTWIFVNK